MSIPNGQFVWYEHLTHDAAAAEAFYRHVVGWSAAPAGIPDAPPYTILSAGDRPVAGLMTFPEGCGVGSEPGWIGYISVDDVDAFVAKVEALGGTLHVGPMEIAEVGRFAVVADPQGSLFALYKSACEGLPPPMGAPGFTGWHELWAKDGAAAFAFYAELFGWSKTEAFDMGPNGVYQLFATASEAVGGMMTADAGVSTGWLFYFNVPELDAAMARVREKGGKVAFGPQEVPGGLWIIQCHDPQGGEFALVAPVR